MQTTTKLAIAIGAALLGVVSLSQLLAAPPAADPKLRSGYVPAREMTDAEARRALLGFERAGQIAVSANADPRFVDLGFNLDAVQFHYAGKPLPVSHVTPQFAVFLVRLAQILRRGFGAVVLEHAGIYPGTGDAADVHNRGAAIDVSSITTIDDGVVSVLNDWGMKPKLGAGYRLRQGDKGYSLFKTLYDFAAREAEDDPGGNHQKRPSQIGDRSLIVSPDHPDAALAQRHREHVHIQIGPTRA